MIGFAPNDIFTEGIIDDSLKAANIDTDKVKDDWDDMRNAATKEEAIGALNKVANDDVLQPLKDDLDAVNRKVKNHSVDRRSLIARSRNSVMQFPVYITQTIRTNEAHIISKLFERVYASLFQTILAQNPIIDQDEANDLVFLKKFHTNINESADLVLYNEFYTPIDELDEIIKESVYYREQVTPTMEAIFRVVPCTDSRIISESSRLSHEPLEGLSYLKEAEEKSTDTTVSWKPLSDKDLEQMALDRISLTNAEKELINMTIDEIQKKAKALSPDKSDDDLKFAVADLIKKKDAAKAQLNQAVKDLKDEIKADTSKSKFKHENGRYFMKDSSSKVSVRPAKDALPTPAPKSPILLRDTDVKKINGMLPYTIEASFIMQDKDGKAVREVHFIIGIKSDLHLIRTQDLAEDLREIVTGNIKSLQKVRYKTGEITLMDYLFNTKGIKNDAAKSINYNKKWLNTLKRLGEWEKVNGSLLDEPAKLLTKGNIPIPNGTMVLAQTDVTAMMNQTGIDLSVVSNAKRLARALFLIAVCIVDSSDGTMRVLFPDSSNDWDVQSLASIDAELSKTDNSQLMRELNRMVNR